MPPYIYPTHLIKQPHATGDPETGSMEFKSPTINNGKSDLPSKYDNRIWSTITAK